MNLIETIVAKANELKAKEDADKLERAETASKLKHNRQTKYEELWSSIKPLHHLTLKNNSLLEISEFNHVVHIKENAYGVKKDFWKISLTEPELDIQLTEYKAGTNILICVSTIEEFMEKIINLLAPIAKPSI